MQIIPVEYPCQHFSRDREAFGPAFGESIQHMMNDRNRRFLFPTHGVRFDQYRIRHSALCEERTDIVLEPNYVPNRDREQIGEILRKSHGGASVRIKSRRRVKIRSHASFL